MDHFPLESWLELAQGLCTAEREGELRTHLDRGCPECQQSFDVWSLLLQAGKNEASFQPPEEEVERVKQAFPIRSKRFRLPSPAAIAQLLYDSFVQPSLAMARSSGPSGARQLVFEAGSLVIDVQMQIDATTHQRFVTGQILGADGPELAKDGISVALMEADREIERTQAGLHGEFELRLSDAPNLSLWIQAAQQELVCLNLPAPIVNKSLEEE